MNALRLNLIRSSWTRVSADPARAGRTFYSALFARAPKLKTVFNGDASTQGVKLVRVVGTTIRLFDRPDALLPALEGIAARHIGVKVDACDYIAASDAFQEMLTTELGEVFSPPVRAAWAHAFAAVTHAIKEGLRYRALPMPAIRRSAVGGTAVILACTAAMPTHAQRVGCHPAIVASCGATGIDPNTFIVGHPASPTVRGGHANFEHPAINVARQAARPSIDPNTFLVQPPATVTWVIAPSPDDRAAVVTQGDLQTSRH